MVTATPVKETTQTTQRELLGLVLGRAARESASFCAVLEVAARMDGEPDDLQALARELLTDLTIRDWIYLVREGEDGRDEPVLRSRYEMELAARANWDESGGCERARYCPTEKGRAKLAPLLGSLGLPPA